MKRKFLEDMGLSKEQIDHILDENSQDIGKAKSELTSVQTELQNAKTEIDGLNNQLSERNTQFSELRASSGNVEELKQKISELEAANQAKDAEHQAEMHRLRLNAAVEAALVGAKAKNIKAVKALLNLEDAELAEDGTVKGLAEQLEQLAKAEDSKFMFDSAKPDIKGARIGEGSDGAEDINLSDMTYSQMVAYMKENPDVKI